MISIFFFFHTDNLLRRIYVERESKIHFRRSYTKQNLPGKKEKKKKKKMVPPDMGDYHNLQPHIEIQRNFTKKKPMPTLTLLPRHRVLQPKPEYCHLRNEIFANPNSQIFTSSTAVKQTPQCISSSDQPYSSSRIF